jgi:divalent metal cation (Fe/Co/Zn/Cd) transporter
VYLSAILLIGLLLNATLGWWWADPLAGLIMVPIIAKEGFDGMRGEGMLRLAAALHYHEQAHLTSDCLI